MTQAGATSEVVTPAGLLRSARKDGDAEIIDREWYERPDPEQSSARISRIHPA
ncbi:hypothetical protein [Methylobacterium tardum]|uniref:hypothetical protein n=1 Tax=Methylobacterium tardum TaxID=374432 RepID=UPI002020F042|nr:hypothetical protein [Methylobacterium tardum]URD34768.1 hypothetical protein M6G65_19555 [Methylobacterium tardum]